jgi:hypothetical protein
MVIYPLRGPFSSVARYNLLIFLYLCVVAKKPHPPQVSVNLR